MSCQSLHIPRYSEAASQIQATSNIVVTESSWEEIPGEALSRDTHGCPALSWWMRGPWSCRHPPTQTLLLLRLGLSAEQGDTWNSLIWWQNSTFTTQAGQREVTYTLKLLTDTLAREQNVWECFGLEWYPSAEKLRNAAANWRVSKVRWGFGGGFSLVGFVFLKKKAIIVSFFTGTQTYFYRDKKEHTA